MRKTGESLAVLLSDSRRFFHNRMTSVSTRDQKEARTRAHTVGSGRIAKRILTITPAFLPEFIVTFFALPETRDSGGTGEGLLPIWMLLFSGIVYHLVVNWCLFPNSDTYEKR